MTDDKQQDLRQEVGAADDTGMVAGEELITEAETLLPLMRRSLPRERMHAALPQEHDAHGTIDRLHEEVHRAQPNRDAIEGHVGRLRAIPELEAAIATWWEDPKTQRAVSALGQIGL
jgi:hypothetical protein